MAVGVGMRPALWSSGLGQSAFDALIAEAQALTFANASTGSRKSVYSGAADRLANTVDSITLSGVEMVSSMAGATNLVGTDMTAVPWYDNAKALITEPESYVYRMSFSGTGATSIFGAIDTFSKDRHCRCEARLISGSFGTGFSNYFSFNTPANAQVGTQFDLDQITSEWMIIDCSVTSADETNQVKFRSENASAAVIEVRTMRAVDLTAPAAGFVDGTGVGEVYAVDSITAPVTITGSAVSVSIPFNPYGWSNTGSPVDATPVLFALGTFEVRINASGFFETSGGAISTKKAVDGVLSSVIVTADGVNHTIRVDGETTVSNASAILPATGTAAWGADDHAALGAQLFERVITESEKDALDAGNTAAAGSIVYV